MTPIFELTLSNETEINFSDLGVLPDLLVFM
jgi:hypothetical protein